MVCGHGRARLGCRGDRPHAPRPRWRHFKAAHTEIRAQRSRIGELLGRIRDLEAEWTQDAVQRITARTPPSNSASVSSPPRTATLDERLKAARSNLRFQDRRIADLEARLTDPTAMSLKRPRHYEQNDTQRTSS
jgi:hypothetical protein